MLLPDTKIEQVCASSKDLRPYLHQPYLDRPGQRLLASNGFALALLPVHVEDADISGTVPLLAIKQARKNRRDPQIKLTNVATVADGSQFERHLAKTYFPDVDKLIPPAREHADLRLNAQLLFDLAQALCQKNALYIDLQFARHADGTVDGDKPVRVTGAYGIGVFRTVRRP